jgi:nitroreductase
VDAYDGVVTKLDVRDFASKAVPASVKVKVVEAARMTGIGMNVQDWRFILVQDRKNLRKLAEDSTTGKWVEGADFAVIVLTNPKFAFHLIDAGRAVQDMQVAAWNYGVASCVFTGVNQGALRRDFKFPNDLTPSVIVGFGYPLRKVVGRKSRKPLTDLAFLESYGEPLNRLLAEA